MVPRRRQHVRGLSVESGKALAAAAAAVDILSGCRVDVLERFLLQIIWTNYLDQFQPYYG